MRAGSSADLASCLRDNNSLSLWRTKLIIESCPAGASWLVMPIFAPLWIKILPVSGSNSPFIILSKVVLPVPFLPKRPTCLP